MAKQLETGVWKGVMLALSPRGYRLFRNQRYKGPIVRNGQITEAWADCGLCDGAADLIGFKIVTVRPEDVGKQLAVFVGIETKTKHGRVEQEQRDFINAVDAAGGISGFVRSQEDALRLFP